MKQWEQLTQRLGFWIHLDEAYVTYHQSYVESVWWSLKNLFDRGLLYQGHKIVWWWARGWDGVEFRRSRTGLPRGGGPERIRLFPAVGRTRHIAAGVDHDTLDPAQQSVRRDPSGPGIRHGARRAIGGEADPGRRAERVHRRKKRSGHSLSKKRRLAAT